MSKSAYCSLCSKINYNACFQAFVGSSGWCFVIFPAVSLGIVRFGAWFWARAFVATLSYGGLLVSGFFWAGSGIFFGFLNFFCSCFSAFLLLCFSACLLFCSLLVCFSCFSCFSAILLFPAFLLLCFSCFSLFCFPVFLLFVFPASLLFYFSAFLFLLVFFCSHASSWYFQ